MPAPKTMPASFSVLIGFQLLGEIAQRVLHLPLPGPVIGMFLLAGTLLFRQRAGGETAVARPTAMPTTHLARTANGLIAHMGLLFVPAGVGIMTQGALLRHQWVAVTVGIMGSTLLSLGVTALVFHHLSGAGDEAPPKRAQTTAAALEPS